MHFLYYSHFLIFSSRVLDIHFNVEAAQQVPILNSTDVLFHSWLRFNADLILLALKTWHQYETHLHPFVPKYICREKKKKKVQTSSFFYH